LGKVGGSCFQASHAGEEQVSQPGPMSSTLPRQTRLKTTCTLWPTEGSGLAATPGGDGHKEWLYAYTYVVCLEKRTALPTSARLHNRGSCSSPCYHIFGATAGGAKWNIIRSFGLPLQRTATRCLYAAHFEAKAAFTTCCIPVTSHSGRKAVVHAPVQHGDVVCVGRCRIGLALHVMREMAVAWSQMLMINGGSSRRQ